MTSETPLPADLEVSTTLDDLRRWADLSGDHNPLHTDPDFAATTRYGRPIVHGHLTIAWIMRWAKAWAGPAWLSAGTVDALRYLAPLHAETTYVVRGAPLDPTTVALTIVQADGTVAVEAALRLETSR